MEILFISHKYPPTIGGMEKQCYELKENPGIQVIHLNDGLMGIFSMWIKSYTSIPVVLTFHGLDLVFPNRIYQRILSKRFTKKFDGFISVSTATAEESIQRGFPKEKVFVVPNGVDHQIADFKFDRAEMLSKFKKQFGVDLNSKKILVTLGRPVRRKGFSWFLENVAPRLEEDVLVMMIGPFKTKKKKSIWRFFIPKKIREQMQLATGGLSDEEKITILLQNQDLRKKVIQTGKVPFEDLLTLLNLAHLFIMPNVKMWGDAEGFGLVALEASLCKAVVLASNLEGIPEAIQNEKNGFLLPSKHIEVWEEKIKSLLADPNQLENLGIQFQQFTLENYSWEKMANQYIEVFRKVINK